MKDFTFILTVVFLMMTSIGAKAQDIPYENFVAVDSIAYDLNLDNKTATVVKDYYIDDEGHGIQLCPKYSGDIVIPEKITVDGVDYKVTEIGNEAFQYCELSSVSLPSTLKVIRESAFFAVVKLKKVKLPASLETIETAAFTDSEELETIEIEEGNTHFVFEDHMLMSFDKTVLYTVIGYYDDEESVEVVVPATIKSIEPYAFYDSYAVVGVTLPEGLETIGNVAFSYTSLTSLHIPASVTNIAQSAFSSTTELKEITVAEGNETFAVKNGMLLSKDLTHLLKIPAKLEVFEIPETVTCIESYAGDETEAVEIVIPDGVKELQDYSFSLNYELETLVVGSGVESWGNDTFLLCLSLKSIYLRSENVVTPTENPFTRNTYEEVTLYVPEGTKKAYELDSYWGHFWNIAEFSLTDISGVQTDSIAPATQIYGIDGKRHDTMRRGLNIVRSQGKARKVVIE